MKMNEYACTTILGLVRSSSLSADNDRLRID